MRLSKFKYAINAKDLIDKLTHRDIGMSTHSKLLHLICNFLHKESHQSRKDEKLMELSTKNNDNFQKLANGK